MCGLVGLIRPGGCSADFATTAIRGMAEAVRHRGPDDTGEWLDANCGIALAHRRLSIVDLSPAGHQPMVSPSGRFVIAFNGEIYNHVQLRSELQAEVGQLQWRGHSDTETLLACIEAWGVNRTVERSVGMFAFGLWDRDERCLHLVRDRMGEKPLYFGWAGDALLFGSELKALRAYPAWRGEVDRDSLCLLFRYGYIPAPHSIYKGVRKLLPGTLITFTLADVRERKLTPERPYWSLREVAGRGCRSPFQGSDGEALAKLELLGGQAVALQRVADVPLGAFLSGGVDSSAIVALMQTQSSVPVRTFTIGFSEDDFNEAQFASAVARHLGTEHTELYVTPEEARATIPRLPEMFDEPFSDSSQIPTFLVSQLARRDVTVSLSGDGGDELFGGYNRYFLGRRLARHLRWIPHQARSVLARLIGAMSPGSIDTVMRPVGWLLPQLKMSQPSDKIYKGAEVLSVESESEFYMHLVSHWRKKENVVVGGTEPVTVLDELLAQRESGESFEQWMMNIDLQTYLPDDILTKVDRAAMAVSLETRVPFLDHRLVEFALSLPLNMKIRDGQSKWLLRQLLYKHVPPDLIERPKMGFGVPIGEWLRGPLRPWAEALLDESRLRREGFLKPESIRRKWNEHVAGRRNWQYHLWDALMFQAWLENETSNAKVPA